MGVLAAFVVQLGTVVTVRMRGVIVSIRAIVGMPVVNRYATVCVMIERHALSGRNGGHALDRNGYRQKRYRKKSNVGPKHPLPL